MSDKAHTNAATHPKQHPQGKSAARKAASAEHKVAKNVYKVNHLVTEVEVMSSGDPRRIRRYWARHWAYKLFGKFMGKTINRL